MYNWWKKSVCYNAQVHSILDGVIVKLMMLAAQHVCSRCTFCGMKSRSDCSRCIIYGMKSRSDCSRCIICGIKSRSNCSRCIICGIKYRSDCSRCIICGMKSRSDCSRCEICGIKSRSDCFILIFRLWPSMNHWCRPMYETRLYWYFIWFCYVLWMKTWGLSR